MKKNEEEIIKFLDESNKIERVNDKNALDDAKKAWDYIVAKNIITIKDVLKIHKLLLNNLNPKIAGKFRTCDVWIGQEKKIFISTRLIQLSIKAILDMINTDFKKLKTKREIQQRIKEHHIMFEGIHPFEDGNGRVGRIIYNWQRIKNGLPIHIIYTGEKQYEYYRWFVNYDKIY
jgi:Fic family protein